MECADMRKCTQAENRMREKLYRYKGDLNKGHAIIETLQKDKETLTVKLREAETKVNEFAIKEQEM